MNKEQMPAGFTPIDLKNWQRNQLFYYFSKMAPTGYSITVELDITVMMTILKSKKIKFFPAYLWVTTKVVNQLEYLKVAYHEENLGYWDELTPMYPHFHDDDKTISIIWTPFNADFKVFYQNYLKNQDTFGGEKTLLPMSTTMPPANCYSISCIPWLEFKHFALHSYDNKPYYFPTIEAGKYFERDGKTFLPFSFNVHHATVDGWHASQFVDLLQKEMNKAEIWTS